MSCNVASCRWQQQVPLMWCRYYVWQVLLCIESGSWSSCDAVATELAAAGSLLLQQSVVPSQLHLPMCAAAAEQQNFAEGIFKQHGCLMQVQMPSGCFLLD
jgi:hypothetical protein